MSSVEETPTSVQASLLTNEFLSKPSLEPGSEEVLDGVYISQGPLVLSDPIVNEVQDWFSKEASDTTSNFSAVGSFPRTMFEFKYQSKQLRIYIDSDRRFWNVHHEGVGTRSFFVQHRDLLDSALERIFGHSEEPNAHP